MKFFHIIPAIMLLTPIFLGCIFIYERNATPQHYFEYYGQVLKKEVMEKPEEVLSYSFGKFNGNRTTMKTKFDNQIWCAPIDSGLRPLMVIIRSATFDDYYYGNDLTGLTVSPMTDELHKTTITSEQAEYVRNNESMFFWSMDKSKPKWDGDCHLHTTVTVYTPLFDIPKQIRYRGPNFTYHVGKEYQGKLFEDQPLDDGSVMTQEEVDTNIIGIRTNRINESDIKQPQYENLQSVTQ